VTNIFILFVVLLFSFKAFSTEEAQQVSDKSKLESSLEQKQIQMIKASLDSENLPKAELSLKKSS
tara:strand:- start:20215 stop:20409 length:195 start_codon:yes stop_codon:yes gene_type:complete